MRWNIHRNIYGLLVLLSYGSPLFLQAQTADQELRLSKAYFESGDFKQAKAGYEGLFDEGLESWKKEIITYNIATALLADENAEEAALRYQTLLDETSNLPLLEQRARSNLVLARLLLLNKHLEALKEKDKVSNEDYLDIFMEFHQIFLDLEKAKVAWCGLETSEGAKNCSRSFDLDAMQLDVKSRFNTFLDEYLSFRLEHADLQEGISALLFGERSLGAQLAVFQQYKFSDPMKEKYLQAYLEQANSWKILWEKLKGTLKKGTKAIDVGKQKGSFDLAYQLFLESVSLVEQGNFQASLTKLESSKTTLNNLLHQFFNDSSAKDILHELVIAYGLALIRIPLQETYLEQLLETQTVFQEVFKQSAEAALIEEYEKAQKYLKLSVESLTDFHPVKARIFAEVARFYIRNIVEQMDFTPKVQATAVLENVIAKEEFILLLHQLRQQAEGDEKELADVDNLIPDLQAATIKAADRFLEVVLIQQKAAFSSEEKTKSHCQCHPWDEVIPLFNDGYVFAERAGQYLENKNFKQSAIERLQRKAVDKWKEALAKMRSSSQSKQSSKQQDQSQDKQQPEDQDQSKEMQPQNAKLNDILRLIQDMEKDDHSKPLFKTATGGKGDERPW